MTEPHAVPAQPPLVPDQEAAGDHRPAVLFACVHNAGRSQMGVAPDAGGVPRLADVAATGGGIDREALQEAVRDHYAAAALTLASDDGSSGCCAQEAGIGSGCYPGEDLAGLPAAAVAASIGCANPVAVAGLTEGEVVLDLGSGGGIDVLLSARRVGPTGKAYGLDMTDEMLDLARLNQRQAAIDNVEFLKGHMEAIPLPDATVDVVLSNCVIALSVNKPSVFAEAFRVLRPGGRLTLADVVAEREPEPGATVDVAAWTDCVSGALTQPQYRAVLEATGFVDASIQFSHAIGTGASSVIVRASKPASRLSRPHA